MAVLDADSANTDLGEMKRGVNSSWPHIVSDPIKIEDTKVEKSVGDYDFKKNGGNIGEDEGMCSKLKGTPESQRYATPKVHDFIHS